MALVVNHALKCLFGILEIVAVRNERLKIDLSLADEIQSELVHSSAIS